MSICMATRSASRRRGWINEAQQGMSHASRRDQGVWRPRGAQVGGGADTHLAAVATPIAGVAGMIIAYLVVCKAFSGKQALDLMSNLGGAVPGTILGIGYILAFIKAPLVVVSIVYAVLATYL